MSEPADNKSAKLSSEFSIPADHPALAGHFPGNPVVPGVVVLELVRQFVESHYPSAALSSIPQAKFSTLLRPEQTIQIEIDRVGSKVRFSCLRATDIIASGEMVFTFGE